VLPYLALQLNYAILSGLLTAALWITVSRRVSSAGARIAVTLVAFGLPVAAGIVAAKLLHHPRSTWQFSFVSLGYYFAVLWLPLLILMDVVRRRAGAVSALFALGALGLGVDTLLVEPNRLTTAEHSVRFDAWPADAPPLRVVHVSDLQSVGACDREREAVRIINEMEPDLIVFTGDYIAGPFGDPQPAIDAARTFFASLRPRLATICIAGHSEWEWNRRRILDGLDVIYLRNEERILDVGHGRRLRLFGSTAKDPAVDRLEPRRGRGLATVALTHVPDLTTELQGRGVDLHLAGHTHGGQIALPFLGPPMTLSAMPRRYARGMHRMEDHWMNLNPGIGMEGHHAPRIRFLCPPQIDLLTITGGGAPERRDQS